MELIALFPVEGAGPLVDHAGAQIGSSLLKIR